MPRGLEHELSWEISKIEAQPSQKFGAKSCQALFAGTALFSEGSASGQPETRLRSHFFGRSFLGQPGTRLRSHCLGRSFSGAAGNQAAVPFLWQVAFWDSQRPGLRSHFFGRSFSGAARDQGCGPIPLAGRFLEQPETRAAVALLWQVVFWSSQRPGLRKFHHQIWKSFGG